MIREIQKQDEGARPVSKNVLYYPKRVNDQKK